MNSPAGEWKTTDPLPPAASGIADYTAELIPALARHYNITLVSAAPPGEGLAGRFPELEQELCHLTTSGYEGKGSPDRADAMVWALTELSGRRGPPGVRGFAGY